MTIDRYLSVCHPIRFFNTNENKYGGRYASSASAFANTSNKKLTRTRREFGKRPSLKNASVCSQRQWRIVYVLFFVSFVVQIPCFFQKQVVRCNATEFAR